ncbi:urease accessory protein UreD [Stappia sp.]|jgi:urease accessory protein|uniref:urease accessory protein UreD n=1 Tax=Stappia sp. TaxID=1870903 RepID=UPI003A99580B
MPADPALMHSTSPPALQRVRGAARVRFVQRAEATRLADLEQSGSAKIRLPKTHDGVPVAVFLNTAGGLTGGDQLDFDAEVGDGARAIVTTQAAERVYKSPHGAATLDSRLRAGDGACLEWLPQETILFDRAELTRSFSADLAPNAALLAVESVVVGREAMGESVHALSFRDRWRIRRDGRLVFADEARISGDATDILSGPATAAGGRAFATVIDCRPGAPDDLGKARALLDGLRGSGTAFRCGVSALTDCLVLRFVAETGQDMREGLVAFLETWRGTALPRTWYC